MPLERIVPSCLRACAAHGRGSAGLDHASVVVPRYPIYNQFLGLATGNHQYVTKTRRSRSTRRTFRLKLRSKASLILLSLAFYVPGQGQFGDKSIVDHARHYLHCSSQHPHEYVHPAVVFYFCQGVTTPLQDALVRVGVTVNDSLQPVGEDTLEKLRGVCPEHEICPWRNVILIVT